METEIVETQSPEITPEECWQQEIREKKQKGLWWKITLAVLGFMLIAAATAAVIVWKVNIFQLSIKLQGEQEITLEYGEAFTDPGAQAFFGGSLLLRQPEAVAVTVEGQVDASTLGTYELTYSAQRTIDYYLGEVTFAQSASRTVRVADTQAPEITLTTNPDTYTIPGQAYAEEGFAATDNHDGDITAQVVRTEQDGKVYYTVSDASGNSVEAVRQIVYHDPVAPELTLAGGADVSITQGNGYAEPGYSAVDNCDGDITGYVTVSGSVDTNTPGVYTLEYSVTDSFNNTTKVTRTVRVNAPVPVPPMPEMPSGNSQTPVTPNGKVIYLTFDDGPSQHTPRLLDILDKYQVKATFFVVNTYYVKYIEDIVERGHTIGVHSATHEFSQIYSSEEAFFADLEKMRNIIYKRTGVYTNLIRFAGGSSNTISKFNPGIMTRLTKLVGEKGYHYFDWNVESGDAGRVTTAEAVLENVIKGCKNKKTSIVLQHDSKGYSVDAVEQIIQWGLENGYTFLTLNENSPKSHHAIFN